MKHFRDWSGSTALSGADPLVTSLAIRAARMGRGRYIRDAFQTFDQMTMDSAGAFLVGELERLDPMVHLPLVSTTWVRDIDLRTDVQMSDATTSYTLTSFGAAGGAKSNGINWGSADQTTIPRVTLDISKTANPLDLVTYEVAYTIPELRMAEATGRPIDSQMIAGMNLKHQMDVDQCVYIGDSDKGTYGLVNSGNVTNTANVATGSGGSTSWVNKSPDEILADINEIVTSTWASTGYAVPPSKLLVAPQPFGYISTQPVVINGTGVAETILSYVKTRNVLTAEKGIPLEIFAVKWLDHTVRGVSTDRMVAYTQRQEFVRFPMVPLQPVQPQFRGIWIAVPYYGRLGVIETVYPETLAYRDGIG